eukprot:5729543-Pyramimonas_sp.AAC.1
MGSKVSSINTNIVRICSTNSFTGVHSPDSIEYDLKLTTSPAGAGRVSFFKRKRQKARSATPNVCKRVENTGERVAGSQQLRVTCRWGVPGGTTSSRLVSSPAHCAGDGRSVKRPIAALEMQRVKATYGTRRRVLFIFCLATHIIWSEAQESGLPSPPANKPNPPQPPPLSPSSPLGPPHHMLPA